MTVKVYEIQKGVRLRPETVDITDNIAGTLWTLTAGTLKGYLGGAIREILTNNQVQTITNKVVDASLNTLSNLTVTNLAAGVLDTDLAVVSASDDTIPSAKATRAAIDIHAALTATHGVSGAIVGTSDVQTLTFKTIDASLNTLLNISSTSFDPALLKTDISVGANNTTIPTSLAAKTYTDTTVNAHINAVTGAHAATAISYAGLLSSINVKLALDEAYTNLVNHAAATSTHGVSGAIVGTTDTQTLSGKSISGLTNTVTNMRHGTEVDNPSSGVHGVVGNVVGTTDTQSLSNKTLIAPTLSGILTASSYLIREGNAGLFQSQTNSSIGLSLAAYKSVRILGHVFINATSPVYETFDLLIVRRASDFKCSPHSVGDSTVTFDVDGAGNLTYTSVTYAGFVSANFQYQIVALF